MLEVAVDHMKVGAADSAGLYFYEYLCRTRLGHGKVLESQLLSGATKNHRSHKEPPGFCICNFPISLIIHETKCSAAACGVSWVSEILASQTRKTPQAAALHLVSDIQ